MSDSKICMVELCSEFNQPEWLFCHAHCKEWVTIFKALEGYGYASNSLLTEFVWGQLTLPNIYPALPTAEEMYEWLSNERNE